MLRKDAEHESSGVQCAVRRPSPLAQGCRSRQFSMKMLGSFYLSRSTEYEPWDEAPNREIRRRVLCMG